MLMPTLEIGLEHALPIASDMRSALQAPLTMSEVFCRAIHVWASSATFATSNKSSIPKLVLSLQLFSPSLYERLNVTLYIGRLALPLSTMLRQIAAQDSAIANGMNGAV